MVKIKVKCDKCGAKNEREIRAGDILTPHDGSGMPQGLHDTVHIKESQPPFLPIKVLLVEGDALFVIPASWRNNIPWDIMTPSQCGAVSWALVDGRGVHGFWIQASTCGLAYKEE